MTLSVVSRLCVLCAAGATLTVAASASAGAHHYGLLINSSVTSGNADQGNSVYIWTDKLDSNTCGDFVTHEMWFGTDSGATYWVEVGYIAGGSVTNGHCVGNSIFWADNRPAGGGFNIHYPNNGWYWDTWYQAQIIEANPPGFPNYCSWGVYLGNTLLGSSIANCPGSGRYLAAGIEATSNTNTSINAKGLLAFWQELGATGWSSYGNWDGATVTPINGSPPFIQDRSGIVGFPETEEWLNASP